MPAVIRRDLLMPLLMTLTACSFCLVPKMGSAQTANWAAGMFKTVSHDFRTVGRGTKNEFHFVLRNKFQEDVHIASIRSSCGCTTPRVSKDLLKTHEEGAIIAKFNTDTFIGQKAATITVVFDQPYYAEVQLKVKGFIRTDITFDPSEVSFGELKPGETTERQVTITRTGNPQWRITDVRSHCKHLQVRLDPPEQSPGIVRYRMRVGLKDSMPEGDIRERLTLISNDLNFPTTEMSISGRIRPMLSVSPAAVSLGTATPGKEVQKRLVVRGEEPFEIKQVVCGDERFKFDIKEGSKKLHFINLRFKADKASSKVGQEIRIVTTLPNNKSTTCVVTGSVGNVQ